MSGVGCLGVCLLRKRRDQKVRTTRHPTVKAKLKKAIEEAGSLDVAKAGKYTVPSG